MDRSARSGTENRKRRTQAERTALSDDAMYNAAIQLLLRGGVQNTTLKDVGELAGYSRGLASSRFGSKEALFGYMVARFNVKWAAELAAHVQSRSGLDAFLESIDAVEAFISGESEETRAMYILWYESISSHPEARAVHARHHEVLRSDARRWISEGIAEGTIRAEIDPDRIAVQFCSFLFGTVYQWQVSPESIDLKREFSCYRETVERQISAH